jgi:HPt (histidine-containing phosphotransfer) domain-containing protein
MPPHRSLINLKTFASVAASTGSSLETKYLPEFEAQLSKDFDLLRTHLLANSMETSERLAHTCVGLCEIMGADALSKELRRIEQGCRCTGARL